MVSGVMAIIVIVATFGIVLVDHFNQQTGGREHV